jgi:hypothetical protein
MEKNSVFGGLIFMIANATKKTLNLLGWTACRLTLLLFLSGAANAQVPDPVQSALAPIPGSAHHYIGVGGETVNPADGSVTFDLPIELPNGRGLTMPFGIKYSGPEDRYLTIPSGYNLSETRGQEAVKKLNPS